MATVKPLHRLSAFVCRSCRQRLLAPTAPLHRALSTTASSKAADMTDPSRESSSISSIDAILDSTVDLFEPWAGGAPKPRRQPHRLHVYSHKHNTHMTLVQPPKLAIETASSSISATSAKAEDKKKMVDVLISLSTGNIGFRKSGRGSFDAAYQLAAFTLKQIQEKGMLRDIRELEVVLRGFGAGREAVTKALLGAEGRFIKDKIKSVVDATRLKHGGTRSKKPRRLG